MYSYTTTGTGENEKINADSVKYNNTAVLSSSYTYDDKGNVLTKSYGENNSIVNTYDSKDRITSTAYAGKTYNYTYDINSQLTAVSGNNYSASYAYDSRGNITSKTVNGVTTSFTYANSGWKDLLISVNDTELEYDANGNVLLYGDREFTWTYGGSLASIIDGNNEYCYTYNENGIRTSKTVNGVTTYFNTKDGVILSQTDGTNNWYFQYDTNGTPLGFVLNGVQYFYITNQMNDVLAITDTSGTIVGNYEYDAWGKVLTADTSIAQQNPLRYRGYYYDNETGYYYLQSRYYDPSICRFINADNVETVKKSKEHVVGINLFAYCNNSPINYVDYTGTEAIIFTVAAIAKIIAYVLLFIGISYTITYIVRNSDFTSVINSIRDLCTNYRVKLSVALELIKYSIKSSYNKVKSKYKYASKAASVAVYLATANAKIKAKVKYNSKCRYWKAYLNYYQGNPYISIGSGITYSVAKSWISYGGNVICVLKAEARTLTKSCGGIYTYHNNNQHNGYFSHYHPNVRKKVHIWFVY